MAKKQDLAGLGMAYVLANLVANEPSTITAQGSSSASATQIGPQQYLISVTASNTGNYLVMPTIGGATGCLLGDNFIINNQLSASVVVTIPNQAGGAASTVSFGGASTTGTTGVSVAANTTSMFWPITASSWCGLKG